MTILMMKMMLLIMMPMILLIMPKTKMLLMILILIFRLIGLRRRGRDTWKRCRRSTPTTWMRWCILRKKKFNIFKIFTLKNQCLGSGSLGSATFRSPMLMSWIRIPLLGRSRIRFRIIMKWCLSLKNKNSK